jgi:hypothetical protein
LRCDGSFFGDDDDSCCFGCTTNWLSFNNDRIASSSCANDNDDDVATLTTVKMVDGWVVLAFLWMGGAMLSVVMTWDSAVEGYNVLGAELDVITSVSLDSTGNDTTTLLSYF